MLLRQHTFYAAYIKRLQTTTSKYLKIKIKNQQ
jgi:hypothetical protein